MSSEIAPPSPIPEGTDVVIVGAGPCGLAAAIALGRAGLHAEVLERGCVVSGIASYPTYMTFFSTAERISIGGMPFVIATEKPTRRDALAYYRAVAQHFDLDVRQYQEVVRLERAALGGESRWLVHSLHRSGEARRTLARAVVIATGYFGTPSMLGVPGETLPHVSHRFIEGHYAFRLPVVVVGGGNSAVDAALDLYRAGAHVTIVHFGPSLDPNIKPWVLPDVMGRIKDGSISTRFNARVVSIDEEAVTVETPLGMERVGAEQVYLMTGYLPNSHLLQQVGVPLDPETGVPAHDPVTMETTVPGIFIAGVIASGNFANRIFIENGRDHGTQIAEALGAIGASSVER